MNIKFKNLFSTHLFSAIALLFFIGFIAGGPLTAAEVPEPGQVPTVQEEFDPAQVANPYHTIVDIDFVKPFVCENLLRAEPREDVLLIDSRPKRPRYDRGHIPTAVSMPDSQFDELVHMLPENKSALLIFHCQNLAWPLSHNSAWKAEELGYNNAVVYARGNVEWDSRYVSWTIEDITEAGTAPELEAEPEAPVPAPATVMEIKEGPYEGSIDNEFFMELMENNPESIRLIDVRTQQEYEAGHIPSAERMDIDMLEANIDSFTDEKPIVFICATGARAGEGYYLFQDKRPDLENVYYVDADVSFTPDGDFTIQ